MHIPQREVATAEAAKLVVSRLQTVLADLSSPKKMIVDAALPIFGIRWNAAVIRRVGKEPLRRILWPLRNSKLGQVSYAKVRDLWLEANADETVFPQLWEPWRAVIERFNLGDERELPSWVEVVDTFVKRGWDTPRKLATVHSVELEAALAATVFREPATQLWRACVLLFADLSSASFLLLKGVSIDAEKLISQLKTAPARFQAVHSDTKYALQHVKSKRDFDSLGPSAKLQRLRNAHLPQFKLNRFFRTASQNLALQGILKCFPSFAAGIRCYFSFCELRGTPHFPVRERAISEWSAIFLPGSTYSNYVGYIRKACHFLEQPLSWDTPAIANTVAALKLRAKGRFRFPNFIRSQLIAQILQFETRGAPFAQLAFLSFLFALRVPSETLKIRRAFRGDDLTAFSPINGEALMGIRGPPSGQRLVLKLRSRKNLPNGCIMSRPCFCGLPAKAAKRMCPVHAIWPCIASRVRPGEKLFSSFPAASVNTALKAVRAKLLAEHAEKYSSHGFRRGSAQELKETGSQWAAIATLGDWKSLAFLGYVDLADEVGRNMAKLLIETDQADSDPELVQRWVKGALGA